MLLPPSDQSEWVWRSPLQGGPDREGPGSSDGRLAPRRPGTSTSSSSSFFRYDGHPAGQGLQHHRLGGLADAGQVAQPPGGRPLPDAVGAQLGQGGRRRPEGPHPVGGRARPARAGRRCAGGRRPGPRAPEATGTGADGARWGRASTSSCSPTPTSAGAASRRLPDAAYAHLERADVVLHAGDILAGDVLDELAGFAPVHAVLGNNDHRAGGRAARGRSSSTSTGCRWGWCTTAATAAGRARRMRRMFPDADVVVFGHSHIPWLEPGRRRPAPAQPGLAHRAPAPAGAHPRHPRRRGRPGGRPPPSTTSS